MSGGQTTSEERGARRPSSEARIPEPHARTSEAVAGRPRVLVSSSEARDRIAQARHGVGPSTGTIFARPPSRSSCDGRRFSFVHKDFALHAAEADPDPPRSREFSKPS